MINKKVFNIDDQVWVKNGTTKQLGTVKDKQMKRGQWRYTVIFGDNQSRILKDTYLSPRQEDNSPYSDLLNNNIGNYFTFLSLITLERLNLKSPLSNNYYSVNATKTQFYPHQLKPLIKFMDSERGRLLICDEVGLGKTIEAGIILKELSARLANELKSTIIVCPSNLREKWYDEIYYKFQISFQIAKNINELIDLLTKREKKLFIITSYEMIRSDKFKDFLEGSKENNSFDLAIFDEAHWMKNSKTKQHKIGKIITSLSERILFLTATPIQMVENDLFNLLHLLDENEYANERAFDLVLDINRPLVKAQRLLNNLNFSQTDFSSHIEDFEDISNEYYYKYDNKLIDNIKHLLKRDDFDYNHLLKMQEYVTKLNLISDIYNRTRKLDVTENKVVRNAYKEACTFDNIEKEYYQKVTEIVKERVRLHNENENRVPVGWIANNYQRQMTSSISAFIRKRRGLNSNNDDYYYEEDSDEYQDYKLGVKINLEIEKNKSILNLENEILKTKTDTKLQKLIFILSEIRKYNPIPKIMLFSFFKPTLKVINKTLKNLDLNVFQIDGDVNRKLRPEIVKEFKNCSEPAILLSSKVGTEGLDFQFADILINFDLPWNPMELEQRIGRLDRIGQESEKIHIYNLYYEDSIEDRILMRLYDRIGIFENSIGELEDIIESSKELFESIYNPDLTDEEKEKIMVRNEKAITNQKKLRLEAELKADEFLGLDQYFTNRINKIKNNKQYVTPKQVNSILENFFDSNFSQAMYQYNLDLNKGSFEIGAEFRRDLKNFMLDYSCTDDADEEVISNILRKTKLEFTLEGITAADNPNLEFINVYHPIVKLLIKHYEKKKENKELINSYNIMLESDDIPEGYYLVFTTIIHGYSYVSRHIFTTIVLRANGEEYFTEEYGIDFLSRLLEKAVDSPFYHSFTEADFKSLENSYDEIIAKKYDDFEEEFKDDASRTYEKKRLSVNKTFDYKISRLQDTINEHKELILAQPEEEKNYNPIIRMNTTNIENLKYQKEKQMNKIREPYDNLSCEYDEVRCIGVLRVIGKDFE